MLTQYFRYHGLYGIVQAVV